MSLATIINNLHARYDTVAGLTGKPKIQGEPTSIHDFPALYTVLDSFTREHYGHLTAMRYILSTVVLFRWTDPQQAEAELEPYANSIPNAIDQEPTLGISNCYVRVEGGEVAFPQIGGTTLIAIIFRVNVLHKAAYQTGGI